MAEKIGVAAVKVARIGLHKSLCQIVFLKRCHNSFTSHVFF